MLIQKIKVSGSSRRGRDLGKGKGRFVKNDMEGDDDSIGDKVKTYIAFVISQVSEEDTQEGTRG